MRKIIFILVLEVFYFQCKAQTGYPCTENQPTNHSHDNEGNLLFNDSFEAAKTGLPDNQGQVDKMHSWTSRTVDLGANATTRWLHSPDWVYSGLPTTNLHTGEALFPMPLTGRGMIGVRNYEVIQQNFKNENMVSKGLYVVSLNIYLSSVDPLYWNNSSLKCYLAKNEISYKDESGNPCTQNYVTYENGIFQSIKEIGSWKLDLTTYPNANGWVRVDAVFEAPDDPFFWDYFAIDLIQNDYDATLTGDSHCEDGCVFIDDVGIHQIDQCGTTCSPDLNPVLMSCLPTAMIADGAISPTQGPFIMYVQNAIGIDFVVDNTFAFNSVIHRQYAYDVNGLIDSLYPDYLFAWIGYPFNNTSNGLLPQDVYVYKFHVWNCTWDYTYLNSLTYVPGNGGFTQGYDIQNSKMKPCCPRDLFIQNKIYGYQTNTVEKAEQTITAGYNVTTPPLGDVICDVTSNVKYVAANINLQPGFTVLPGAHFEAIYTGDCDHADIQRKAAPKKNQLRGFQAYRTAPKKLNYSISPNPSLTGRFTYNFEEGSEFVEKIEVYNSMGQQVFIRMKPDRSNILDLSSFGSGMYVVRTKIANTDNYLIDKLIVP